MSAELKAFEQKLEEGYENKYAVLAGYLPQDREKIDQWLAAIKEKVQRIRHKEHALKPSVKAFKKLLNNDGIARMYVSQMIEQVPKKYQTVTSIKELLLALNHIVQTAPEYKDKSHFPMSALFVYMMYTPAGFGAFKYPPLNDALRKVLQEWCEYLDSKASAHVLNKKNGWLSPAAWNEFKLYDFILPDPEAADGGFESFNAFFHRQIKPECRPIAGKKDSKVIVSANDGKVYNIQRNVKRKDTFWIKSQPYSLKDMLDNSKYLDKFVGGDVFQSFLSGADYHRWRAPISGTVKEARVINGLMFSELFSEGFDSDAGIKSQGYEASVNTRGLVIIESDDKDIGLVAVMPVGITEISSVNIDVKVGDRVSKGDELGRFSYGGSTLCLVFEPYVIKEFTISDKNSPVRVNAQIATAN